MVHYWYAMGIIASTQMSQCKEHKMEYGALETQPVDKARENRLRRHADRLGLGLRKSRARYFRPDNQGGYMLFDVHTGAPQDGWNYDLDLDYVEEYLRESESALKIEAQNRPRTR